MVYVGGALLPRIGVMTITEATDAGCGGKRDPGAGSDGNFSQLLNQGKLMSQKSCTSQLAFIILEGELGGGFFSEPPASNSDGHVVTTYYKAGKCHAGFLAGGSELPGCGMVPEKQFSDFLTND